jgi:hypothetical protein
MKKTRMTLAIDEDARKLIDHYAGKRGIGHFFGELVKKYDVEEHYGTEMIRRRLDRIETHLLHLLDGSKEVNSQP